MFTVGVYRPQTLPESFNVCIDNIVQYLPELGASYFCSGDPAQLSAADVIWDPRAGGGHAPPKWLTLLEKPLIITLHGVGPLVFPEHYSEGLRHRFEIYKSNRRKKKAWKAASGRYSRIVTVSEFSKKVINDTLNIPSGKIDVILNGVDLSVFTPPENPAENTAPYFLHVSNDESRKNVDRIIKAYEKIKADNKWSLILKLAGDRTCDVPGVKIINKRLSAEELVALYARAGAFVFPSVYEGFGIPIIEAMAMRCPVITSSGTACEEVAASYATLVDPASVSALSSAMESLMLNPVSEQAIEAAVKHAGSFSWKETAEQYYRVFLQSAGEGKASK